MWEECIQLCILFPSKGSDAGQLDVVPTALSIMLQTSHSSWQLLLVTQPAVASV